jgi:uncharacterized protein (AIM24 family)
MTDSYRKPTQSEKRNGVTMTAHRYAEKRLITRGIPNPDGVTTQYVAEGTDIYQLEIKLEGGGVLIEPGALQYMHGRIETDVVRHEAGKGFLSRAISSAGTGESAHATRMKGDGTIWCEPGRRHFVIATMDGDKDALLLDDRAFYACSDGISLSTHKHNTIAGMFSGNGFMQPKLSGNGVFAVESPVPVEEIEQIEVKRGEKVTVDGDFMLMYSAGLTVEIGPLVSGIRNAMRSGEGFVYKLSGEGSVWVMPTAKLS